MHIQTFILRRYVPPYYFCVLRLSSAHRRTNCNKERTNERKNCVVLRGFVCCRCYRFPFVGGKLSRGFYSWISYRTQIAILFKRARFQKHDGGAICSPVPPLHFFFFFLFLIGLFELFLSGSSARDFAPPSESDREAAVKMGIQIRFKSHFTYAEAAPLAADSSF